MPSVNIFQCPPAAALGDVDQPDCTVSVGNVVGIAFQKYQGTPSFSVTSIKLLATWTPLLASTSATGIRFVPAQNFETTPGEAITEGGNDQTTYRGRKKLKYVGFTDASFIMEGISSTIATQVRNLTQFSVLPSQRTVLRAFLITDEGYVISASDFNGIEIHCLVVQDVKKGGSFKPSDDYAVMFSMDYGWSHDATTTKLSFDESLIVNP